MPDWYGPKRKRDQWLDKSGWKLCFMLTGRTTMVTVMMSLYNIKGYLYSTSRIQNLRTGFFSVRQNNALTGRMFWFCCFLMLTRFLTVVAPWAAANAVFQPVLRILPESVVVIFKPPGFDASAVGLWPPLPPESPLPLSCWEDDVPPGLCPPPPDFLNWPAGWSLWAPADEKKKKKKKTMKNTYNI